MVVWEDRGVLKPPKPPTVHATERGGVELHVSLVSSQLTESYTHTHPGLRIFIFRDSEPPGINTELIYVYRCM